MRYRRGDELVLKIEEDFGYCDKTHRRVKVQVIGYNIDCDGPDAEYLVYVPAYESMAETWTLTERHADWYGANHKFIGDTVAFINADHPISQHFPSVEGENCDRCNEFVAGGTRKEDASYTCRACTLNPWR